MIAALLDRLRQGDRNALARLVSYAARGEHRAEIQSALLPSSSDSSFVESREGEAPAEPLSPEKLAFDGSAGASPSHPPARVIAFTGSGGVGKSSLIGKLIPILRTQNHKVAVLACDPQSPLSGGALLGDRFRMGSTPDDGVFIRSLAALSGHGALADHLDLIIRLLETFGFDVIFLETVGSGQGDVEVRDLADVVVLLLQPESGDDVQWEKAGILECADVVVVHKSDLPAAEQTAAQVRAALDLSPASQVPVVRVSTKSNQGHAELWQAIAALPLRRTLSSSRRLLQLLCAELEARFRAAEKTRTPAFLQLLEDWQNGEKSTAEALRELGRLLL